MAALTSASILLSNLYYLFSNSYISFYISLADFKSPYLIEFNSSDLERSTFIFFEESDFLDFGYFYKVNIGSFNDYVKIS